ncbi:L-ribulose-5-phosphate 4-epimerase (EC [Olavius sp. associated proteobacterium Delta 1]|nr:L-ribulose-5-phosphate 4-epimerase (EC [Olavius sp. associated proteobacterium Delta 1]
MDLTKLKHSVYRANMELIESGLVLYTFGNVSGVDRERAVMVIKPSGVPYEALAPEKMVCVSLETGKVIDGDLNPSSDTPTHFELYRAFATCGGIAHTHSEYATACAQARIPIRCMGTTQADYFLGDIPVTREMNSAETSEDYEKNTGLVITETFRNLNPAQIPAVLVANHGPFVWGRDPAKAVYHAVIVEFLAKMEVHAAQLNPQAPRPPRHLIEKHYLRKHGRNAYYGQHRK